MYPFMKQEIKIHWWIDLLDYLGKIAFLLICNAFVRRNGLAKGYHFLIVILGFAPIAYWFLSFMIWRKLNRAIAINSGKNFIKSDRKIVFIWVLIILMTLFQVSYSLLETFSNTPELVSTLTYYRNYQFIAKSLYILLFSVVYLLYFIDFRKITTNQKKEVIELEHQLIDN
jgi:hypothetical protein